MPGAQVTIRSDLLGNRLCACCTRGDFRGSIDLFPLIQRYTVELPTVLTLFSIVASLPFGVLGLLLSVPLTLVLLIFIKRFYVHGLLGHGVHWGGLSTGEQLQAVVLDAASPLPSYDAEAANGPEAFEVNTRIAAIAVGQSGTNPIPHIRWNLPMAKLRPTSTSGATDRRCDIRRVPLTDHYTSRFRPA